MKAINLSKIGTAPKNGKSEYPLLPDPEGTFATLVDEFRNENQQKKALDGSLKLKKGELSTSARAFYLGSQSGKQGTIPSSVEVAGNNGNVLVVMTSRYSGADKEALKSAIGSKMVEKWFYQSFEIKVDGDKIPTKTSQKLIDELVDLFNKYNAADALTAKSEVKPVEGFHEARHSILTVAQNEAVDSLCPSVIQVKER